MSLEINSIFDRNCDNGLYLSQELEILSKKQQQYKQLFPKITPRLIQYKYIGDIFNINVYICYQIEFQVPVIFLHFLYYFFLYILYIIYSLRTILPWP